jgi:hypothetical protein
MVGYAKTVNPDSPGCPPSVSAVKLMLPCLDDRIPTIAGIAEMAGISIGSFQRKLFQRGRYMF